MSTTTPPYESVIKFWFEEIEPRQWWVKDPQFDALIASRFATVLQKAAAAELLEWRGTVLGRLAEILVLDQFSRNIHRDTPQAFAQDGIALVLAQEAVSRGVLDDLDAQKRAFLLMPYMHSESPLVHHQAEPLFRLRSAPENYDFELRHKAIIDKFGRYPHRNAILGRTSTAAETEFLRQPGSAF